jgi:S-DNA-T family DNA segregation ATPase FtsK/SpoIIIE
MASMTSCESCGYAYDALSRPDLPGAVRTHAAAIADRLRTAEVALLRRRPSPEVWSALEYSCHVRDVVHVQIERLGRALTEDEPDFVPMNREERVLLERYNEQSPEAVAAELEINANSYAAACERLTAEQWLRGGVYHWPVTTVRSMDWVARNTIHELIHHTEDIDRNLPPPGRPSPPGLPSPPGRPSDY